MDEQATKRSQNRMIEPLYPYDDAITEDGFLWAIKRDGESVLAVVAFERVSPRFLDLMSAQTIRFILRSRVCQLGLDAVLEHVEVPRPAPHGIECTISLHTVAGCPLASDVLTFLEKAAPRLPLGKLFLPMPQRRLAYADVVLNTYAEEAPPIEATRMLQGPDDLVVLPVDSVTYRYNEEVSLTGDQVVYLLTEGTRRDLEFLRTRVTAETPHRVPGRGWVLTRLPHFVLREHFATVEALTLRGKRVAGLRHASASLFDPLSYKETTTSAMVEVLNEEAEELEFDGVALQFYRPDIQYCSVQLPGQQRLAAILGSPKHLQEQMDGVLRGAEAGKGRTLQCAAFVVDRSDVGRVEELKCAKIAPRHVPREAKGLDMQDCPEQEILLDINRGHIRAPGFLLSYYFPRWDVGAWVEVSRSKICALIFRQPSYTNGFFFSDYDVSRLHYWNALGIPVIWLRDDGPYHYVVREDCGFFMKEPLIDRFREATFFACYGSSVKVAKHVEQKLSTTLRRLKSLFGEIGVVTGGGPGAMTTANRAALSMGLLSAACYLSTESSLVRQDPDLNANVLMGFDQYCRHIRQRNFGISRFPIFFPGGLGTLEEIGIEMCNWKLGVRSRAPYIFVEKDYWSDVRKMFSRMADSGMVPPDVLSDVHFVSDLDEIPGVYEAFLSGASRPVGGTEG